MNFKFHLSSDPNVKQLLELFVEMNAKNRLFVNIFNENNNQIQKKLSKVTKLLYKAVVDSLSKPSSLKDSSSKDDSPKTVYRRQFIDDSLSSTVHRRTVLSKYLTIAISIK